jgi:hypothetical protein
VDAIFELGRLEHRHHFAFLFASLFALAGTQISHSHPVANTQPGGVFDQQPHHQPWALCQFDDAADILLAAGTQRPAVSVIGGRYTDFNAT